ncbi:MAG: hypothetical protein IH612_00140 [Desulfofustis sp.]|nr:hypothetical protein [Desulfofustis sp.]
MLQRLGDTLTNFALSDIEQRRQANLEAIRRQNNRDDFLWKQGHEKSDMIDPETGRILTNEQVKSGEHDGAISATKYNENRSQSGMLDKETGRPLTKAEVESGQFQAVPEAMWERNARKTDANEMYDRQRTDKTSDRDYAEGSKQREIEANIKLIEKAVADGRIKPEEGEKAIRQLFVGKEDKADRVSWDKYEGAIDDAVEKIMQQSPGISYDEARAKAQRLISAPGGRGGAGGDNSMKPPMLEEQMTQRFNALVNASPEDREDSLKGIEDRYENGKEKSAKLREMLEQHGKQSQVNQKVDRDRNQDPETVMEYAKGLSGLKDPEQQQQYLDSIERMHGPHTRDQVAREFKKLQTSALWQPKGLLER